MRNKSAIQNLVIKDFIAGWPYLIIIIVLIPFLISISFWAMLDDFGGLAMGFITFITFLLCKGTSLIFILVDSVYKGDAIYLSLPINRKTLVLSKYITALLLVVFSFSLILTTIWFIYNLSGGIDSEFNVLLSFRGIFATLSILIISLSFLLPFLIVLGEGKGMKYYFITLGFIALIDPIAKFLTNILSGVIKIDLSIFVTVFESTLVFIRKLSLTELYLFLFLIISAVFTLSVLVSIKYYPKRDI